jgi:hypothetical protein
VAPAGATLTVTMNLAAMPPRGAVGDPGADASAAEFTPPSTVTMTFAPSSAAFQSVGPASVAAYLEPERGRDCARVGGGA